MKIANKEKSNLFTTIANKFRKNIVYNFNNKKDIRFKKTTPTPIDSYPGFGLFDKPAFEEINKNEFWKLGIHSALNRHSDTQMVSDYIIRKLENSKAKWQIEAARFRSTSPNVEINLSINDREIIMSMFNSKIERVEKEITAIQNGEGLLKDCLISYNRGFEEQQALQNQEIKLLKSI